MAAGRVFLVDSFGYIFRAYHARARSGAPPMRTSRGLSTEAVYIFHNMMRKLVSGYQPEYLAAVFESEGPTFREQEFAEYKANREAMPPDLAEQIPWVRKTLEAMGIPILESAGFEADDVIGTVAKAAVREGFEVVIVSSDKDMMQLVGEGIAMLNPLKEDRILGPREVEEFLGVPPGQVADLLALKGDAIDNIPGAPGIGEKGARELLKEFGSLEALLERAGEVKKRTYRESLQNHKEQILLSKRLATIDCAAPIVVSMEALKAKQADVEALRQIYRELEFYSLLRELERQQEVKPEAQEYRELNSAEEVQEVFAGARAAGGSVAVCLGEEGGVLGTYVGLATGDGRAYRAPVTVLAHLKGVLEEDSYHKTVFDAKAIMGQLRRQGIGLAGVEDDVLLLGFLLTADPGASSLAALAMRHLHSTLDTAVEAQAACIATLAARLKPEVMDQGLMRVYEEIELPLAPVLARMEETGIRVDREVLAQLSVRLQEEVERLTAAVHALAGKVFNLNSPQQLGKVLFEDLKLPAPARSGKGKTLSTAADILEELAPQHEIVRKVLDYRQVAKLKNTYVDALPELIDPHTGRIHTTFNQTGAATGRLSSSNPNLQNIPIRTEQGREIRAAFVPCEGWKMVVADYSQIELRLLAHMSEDAVLVEAFRKGEDIHARTAAEVFGVMPGMVTPEMRRAAKAVNFGIIYGQTSFGLAAQLGIGRAEAETYIRNYFERYAGVKRFIEETICDVRASGYAKTLFGRRRPIPDIQSRNPNARAFAERTAVNTPIQGTAADFIKLAMVRVARRMEEERLEAKMLLQVHDELVFEAPPEEVVKLGQLVKQEMESVAELRVPLVADIGVGDNWRDAK